MPNWGRLSQQLLIIDACEIGWRLAAASRRRKLQESESRAEHFVHCFRLARMLGGSRSTAAAAGVERTFIDRPLRNSFVRFDGFAID